MRNLFDSGALPVKPVGLGRSLGNLRVRHSRKLLFDHSHPGGAGVNKVWPLTPIQCCSFLMRKGFSLPFPKTTRLIRCIGCEQKKVWLVSIPGLKIGTTAMPTDSSCWFKVWQTYLGHLSRVGSTIRWVIAQYAILFFTSCVAEWSLGNSQTFFFFFFPGS